MSHMTKLKHESYLSSHAPIDELMHRVPWIGGLDILVYNNTCPAPHVTRLALN